MNNEMIGRARALLAQKMASEASPLARLRGKSSKVSSADAFFSGLVEGAFLLAAADGEMSEDEEATLAETLVKVTGDAYEPAEFVAMINAFDEALEQDGLAGRLSALAGSLPDAAARREVLAFAVLIALCDRHLADTERAALQQMGDVLGISATELEGIVTETRRELGLPPMATGRRQPPPLPPLRQGGRTTIDVDASWLLEAGVELPADVATGKTIQVDEDWLEEVRRTLASQKVDAAWLAKIRGGLQKPPPPKPPPPPAALQHQLSARKAPPPLPRDEAPTSPRRPSSRPPAPRRPSRG